MVKRRVEGRDTEERQRDLSSQGSVVTWISGRLRPRKPRAGLGRPLVAYEAGQGTD